MMKYKADEMINSEKNFFQKSILHDRYLDSTLMFQRESMKNISAEYNNGKPKLTIVVQVKIYIDMFDRD